jgi:NTP pyrophosphatase (non-canonical NTP hydrolase)
MPDESALVRSDEMDTPRSAEEWLARLHGIYSKANSRQMLLGFDRRVLRWAGALACPKYHVAQHLGEFDCIAAKCFGWLAGMLNHSRLKIKELSKLVYLEYPDVCPYCFRGPCDGCTGKTRDRGRANRLGLERTQKSPVSFDLEGIARHAIKIYPGNADMYLATATGRLVDECRELSQALDFWNEHKHKSKPKALEKIREELPDVLMWFSTAVYLAQREKVVRDGRSQPRVDDVLWGYYRYGCPACSPDSGSRICSCDQGASDAQLAFDDFGIDVDRLSESFESAKREPKPAP